MKKQLLLLPLLTWFAYCSAQFDSNTISIMFYNTENFFDPADDTLKNDDSYTIEGMNRWSYKKMYHKRDQIAKVILSINQWNPPDIIGLAEIENDVVLKSLIRHPGLQKNGYMFIHYESPDSRGIDVAMLYRERTCQILEAFPIPVVFPLEPGSKNRDILYAKVKVKTGDTLHLFVNHWTSRFGGAGATISKRNFYAFMVKEKVDSLLAENAFAHIVIMGDFNDYPTDHSVYTVLEAQEPKEPYPRLINMMLPFHSFQNEGTHKNEAFWGCLDQMILSRSFFLEKSCWKIPKKILIYKPEFLLVPDEKFGGTKPFRTFLGFKYLGGFSDHLPILLILEAK